MRTQIMKILSFGGKRYIRKKLCRCTNGEYFSSPWNNMIVISVILSCFNLINLSEASQVSTQDIHDRKRTLIKDFSLDEEMSDANNGNETYTEAKILFDFFEKCNMDYVSPLTREIIFISMKDSSGPDILEVVERKDAEEGDEETLFHFKSNSTSKYIVPQFPLFKRTVTSRVEGMPIYVNYGRNEDFDYLKINKMSLKKYIALIRFGKISVYDKIRIAFSRGISGVLLFSDLRDYPAVTVYDTHEEIIPVVLGKLQEFYASLDNADDNYEGKSIPVQIIPGSVAGYLLKMVIYLFLTELSSMMPSSDAEIPELWKGSMNSTYSVRTGFKNVKWSIKMRSTVVNIRYANYDLMASMRGHEEPDRYVIVGANRQPMNTLERGLERTGVTMEIAKILSELKQNGGWVPRRTVLLLSWGLEGVEYYRSPQWMQQHKQMIMERAVAYFHIDDPVQGIHHLNVRASPPLHNLIINVASAIRNPNEEEVSAGKIKTVLDTWNAFGIDDKNEDKSKFDLINDYWILTFSTPSVAMSYINENENSKMTGINNVEVAQPYKEAVMYVLISMVYRFAETDILPYKMTRYSSIFNWSVTSIYEHFKSQLYKDNNIASEFNQLRNAVSEFTARLNVLDQEIEKMLEFEELELRILNDQIMNVNRLLMCTESQYNRLILLSDGVLNGTVFGVLQEALLSDQLISSSMVVINALKDASWCLNRASQSIISNFI